MQRAAAVLGGQKLIGIEIAAKSARTTFTFDLGAELVVRPIERLSEMWMLFDPAGKVLTLRADRKYAYEKATQDAEDVIWKPVLI